MRSNHSLIALALIGIGAALAFKSRGVFTFEPGEELSAVPIDEESGQPDVGELFYNGADDGFYQPPNETEGFLMNDDATPDERLQAFLYMIRASEHRFPSDVVNDACYALFYSRIPFTNLADHPVITRELRGVRLPDKMCRDAGFSPGCVSTAAGAYQIIRPTWDRVRVAGSWGPRLPDFSKASQDEAARRILMLPNVDALRFVLDGNFEEAASRASKQWASLPAATANQNPRSWAFAVERYNEALAGFA